MKYLSVIVPVYNTEKYLSRCISSILGQTWTDLEVILVDDGSTDESGRICDDYAASDPRVKVIHKNNGGVSAARNDALRIAEGEFIGFVDSDDWIAPHTYEHAISKALESGSDIVQFNFCNIVDGNVREVRKRFNAEGLRNMPLKPDSWNSGWYSVCNKLIRKSLFIDNSLSFYEWSRQCEDAAMCILLFSYVNTVYCVGDVFYFRVSRGNSALHTIDRNGYENRINTFSALETELKDRKRDAAYIALVRKQIRRNRLKKHFFRLKKRI